MDATVTRSRAHLFGVGVDPRQAGRNGNAKLQVAREAGELLPISRLKRLSAAEWDTLYTSKAFPDSWGRYFNSQVRDYQRHYKAVAGDAPQYKTLCWRAAALSTTLAIMESSQALDVVADRASSSDRARFDQRLVECIGQLQRYTESEKHESVIIDATKERVLSLVIAVADHVLADEAKPALFGALRRVIAGGELDPSRAISMLSQAVEAAPRQAGTVIDSTSRPLPDGDSVDVLRSQTVSEPEAMPDSVE